MRLAGRPDFPIGYGMTPMPLLPDAISSRIPEDVRESLAVVILSYQARNEQPEARVAELEARLFTAAERALRPAVLWRKKSQGRVVNWGRSMWCRCGACRPHARSKGGRCGPTSPRCSPPMPKANPRLPYSRLRERLQPSVVGFDLTERAPETVVEHAVQNDIIHLSAPLNGNPPLAPGAGAGQ